MTTAEAHPQEMRALRRGRAEVEPVRSRVAAEADP